MKQSTKRLPRTTRPLTDIPFVFESYRDLTLKLGAVDGHAASLSLAAMFFSEQSRQQADDQALGLSLAEKYKVSTRFIDLNNLPAHLHQLLIVGTTRNWEEFLVRFRREQLALGNLWRPRDDDEDRLSHVLDCLSGQKSENIDRIGRERYDLLHYYRLVRNAAAHEPEKSARLDQNFKKIEPLRELVSREYGLDAPNPFPETKFDDHMLYTRVAKYVATDLCRLAPPVTFLGFQKVLTDRTNFTFEPTFILRHKASEVKLRKALCGFLQQHYNFRLDLHPELLEELRSRLITSK